MHDRTTSTRTLARAREFDPYEVLQVSPHASPDVIRAAYRVLARDCHPDVNDGQDSTRKMRELNAAYAALSNPVRRAAYDARTQAERGTQLRRLQARERLVHSEARRASAAVAHAAPVVVRPAGHGRAAILVTFALLAGIMLALVLAVWIMNYALDDRPAPPDTLQDVGAAPSLFAQILAAASVPDGPTVRSTISQPVLNRP